MMSKLAIVTIVFCVLVVGAGGATFRFNEDQALDFDRIAGWSVDPDAAFLLATINDIEYDATHELPANSVGIVANYVGESTLSWG